MEPRRGYNQPIICHSKARTLKEYRRELREFIKKMQNEVAVDSISVLSINRTVPKAPDSSLHIHLDEMITISRKETAIRTRPIVDKEPTKKHSPDAEVEGYMLAIKTFKSHQNTKKTKIYIYIDSADRNKALAVHLSIASLSKTVKFTVHEAHSILRTHKFRQLLKIRSEPA